MKNPYTATVTEATQLLEFLFARWPEVKKSKIKEWLKNKFVHVNGAGISQFNHPLNPGDVVSVEMQKRAAAFPNRLKQVFEDESILVIEKPTGLLSMASESERDATAYAMLNEYVRASKGEGVWIVHRLDRETSGLMVFAKHREAQRTLENNWPQTEKFYLAVVQGAPKPPEGVLRSHLDESQVARVFSSAQNPRTREAITYYRVLKQTRGLSLVELRLETGRRHQIRVQLSDIGCPCVGDEKYGARGDPAGRLGLHSCHLIFPHPVSGAEMNFTSPLPSALARLLD